MGASPLEEALRAAKKASASNAQSTAGGAANRRNAAKKTPARQRPRGASEDVPEGPKDRLAAFHAKMFDMEVDAAPAVSAARPDDVVQVQWKPRTSARLRKAGGKSTGSSAKATD
ncbi:hypothetical protein P43SY_009328 [Pythium insidiosum]|uniref:Uncharacterized protein n=1 Tax=Pythium insidiosum TaxID=114742 RepID=A0AAD5LTC2_PYTIN|nr:hypothetical protein P43SY_009328 [Pythium insidiosum]